METDGFLLAKNQRKTKFELTAIARAIVYFNYLTDEELYLIPAGSKFIFDSECYANFFFVAFKHVDSGKIVVFEKSPAEQLNVTKLRWMLWRFCLIGFNSIRYDMPMITLACEGKSNYDLKQASNKIIGENLYPYFFEKEFKVKIPKVNQIDLIEVAPLQGTLKLYAARLHCKRLQELPIDVESKVTEAEAELLRQYCIANDLEATHRLFDELTDQIALRSVMSEEYNVDLRSKSDAQIAEAVINSELERLTGEYPHKTSVPDGYLIQYKAPDYVQFKSPALQKIKTDIEAAFFELDGMGSPKWPDGLGEREKDDEGSAWVLKTKIGGTVYKLGMGGLHSQEKSVGYRANAEYEISDNDVESYYPRIIINEQLYPEHLGPAFITVYESIVNRRIDAKRTGNKKVSDSLKITINGSFGKLGNKYSTLYAPKLLLQVTITGQLSLMMLIEMLTEAGIDVISGNTDGIVSRYLRSNRTKVRSIVEEWERITNFKTEETQYAWLYSRDVNNYYAAKLKQDKTTKQWLSDIDEIKTKGVYSDKGSALNSPLSKNPEATICSDAVQSLLRNSTPIKETIENCNDLTRFLCVKNVKGGGAKGNLYLGKVVRWYYAKNEAGCISYVGSGNKVAKSDGAKPLMDLPDVMPTDIDYSWYIKEAEEILFDIGFKSHPKTLPLF